MNLVYRCDIVPSSDAVCALFDDSGLRRPTGDQARIKRMLEEADVLWTVWDGDELVGLARSITDYVYCCYLSDLAVSSRYQKKGIGKELIRRTQDQLGEQVMILLLAAETARGYYEHIGFERVTNGWMLARHR